MLETLPSPDMAVILPGHLEGEGILRLYLPVPPSVNALYKKGKHGNKYRDPKLVADEGEQVVSIRQTARALGWKPIVPVRLEIVLYWNPGPVRLRRDLDNVLKVLLDRLAKAIGVDDDWFHDIHLVKVPSEDNSFTRIRVWGKVE